MVSEKSASTLLSKFVEILLSVGVASVTSNVSSSGDAGTVGAKGAAGDILGSDATASAACASTIKYSSSNTSSKLSLANAAGIPDFVGSVIFVKKPVIPLDLGLDAASVNSSTGGVLFPTLFGLLGESGNKGEAPAPADPEPSAGGAGGAGSGIGAGAGAGADVASVASGVTAVAPAPAPAPAGAGAAGAAAGSAAGSAGLGSSANAYNISAASSNPFLTKILASRTIISSYNLTEVLILLTNCTFFLSA